MAINWLLPTHWYYNTESGQLTQGNNLENLGNNLVGGAGWHELNVPGNATEAQAAAAAVKEFPNGKPPTTAGITPGRVASTAADLAGTGTIDDLINFIKQGSLWERVVEVVAGLIIMYVGVKAMATPTGQQPAKRSLRDTAKTVAEVAAK